MAFTFAVLPTVSGVPTFVQLYAIATARRTLRLSPLIRLSCVTSSHATGTTLRPCTGLAVALALAIAARSVCAVSGWKRPRKRSRPDGQTWRLRSGPAVQRWTVERASCNIEVPLWLKMLQSGSDCGLFVY